MRPRPPRSRRRRRAGTAPSLAACAAVLAVAAARGGAPPLHAQAAERLVGTTAEWWTTAAGGLPMVAFQHSVLPEGESRGYEFSLAVAPTLLGWGFLALAPEVGPMWSLQGADGSDVRVTLGPAALLGGGGGGGMAAMGGHAGVAVYAPAGASTWLRVGATGRAMVGIPTPILALEAGLMKGREEP